MSIVGWWSGGITSAVACKKAIELYGKDRCRIIMIDTHNEDEDTYRFKVDCEEWYGIEIETISAVGSTYKDIQNVWYKHNSLNVAHGAVCSSELKRRVREKWQASNKFAHQVFGFEFNKKEFNRARGIVLNHSHCNPIFPLLLLGLDKQDCINIVTEAGIAIPRAYSLGFHNNNCLKTGCVQGGIGYWKKMQAEFPEKFNKMAQIEHDLTNRKGKPVTMLKDQSKVAKSSGNILVFLKSHPDYPNLKSLDDMQAKEVKPLTECNGFCGTYDLTGRSSTEDEINFEELEDE